MTSVERFEKEIKIPCGAVRSGTDVRFVLHCAGFNDVKLIVKSDDGDACMVSMKEDETGFSCSFLFEREGLYFCAFSSGEKPLNITPDGTWYIADEFSWIQQTVYSKEYTGPNDICGRVAYQIFPDRFAVSGDVKRIEGRRYHQSFDQQPNWKKDPDGEFRNLDFFGGNLKGIEENLDYLSSLGVGLIYLNPIFSSPSNHRYDTSDYMKIDPQLGTEDDFVSLCRQAEKRNIKIILDGVFSHTGDDSVYFDKYGRYGKTGAFQSMESPYYSWYKFTNWPYEYTGWWGIKTLPEVKENTPSYVQFIAGENGVISRWMRLGASGFRLDVADELPDSFIEKIREAVKRENPDGLLIGEVWEDASNKVSYGERRRYFLGSELDGVMGYTLRTAILDFVRDADGQLFRDRVTEILFHYPPEMLCCCLNMLSSHDTPRAINMLSAPEDGNSDREYLSSRTLSRDEYLRGVEMLKLSFALLFFLPGIPMIYYGDEGGMQGYGDPFCRGFFQRDKADAALTDYVKHLSSRRNEYVSALKGADTEFFDPGRDAVCFVRGKADERIIFLLNRGEEKVTFEAYGTEISADPWKWDVKKI